MYKLEFGEELFIIIIYYYLQKRYSETWISLV